MYFIDSLCFFITFHNNTTKKFLQSTMSNLFEYVFILVYIHFSFNTYSFECLKNFSNFCCKDLRHKRFFKVNSFKNLATLTVGTLRFFCLSLKRHFNYEIDSKPKQVLRREQIIIKTHIHFSCK